MSEHTAKLHLPYIMPSQAQKHVTHNEALQRIDASAQLIIISSRTTPPNMNNDGDCYCITEQASGDWAYKANNIAYWQDGHWQYISPSSGWTAWFKDTSLLHVYDEDDGWQPLPIANHLRVETIGINTTADNVNKLSISANACLLTHGDLGDHQLKINKSTIGNTASLLFQSGWSGRAEMGLTGNNDFNIKVSPNGSNWNTALQIAGNGIVSLPMKPFGIAHALPSAISASNNALMGFTSLNNNQGGIALGQSVNGTMKALVVPVTGTYRIILNVELLSTIGCVIKLQSLTRVFNYGLTFLSSNSLQKSSCTFLVNLNQGEEIFLVHNGASMVNLGQGQTELSIEYYA